MSERFTIDKGTGDDLPVFYDGKDSISYDDVCNLLNDYSNEDKRLNNVIINLHDNIRNQKHKIRRLEQLTIQLNDIIDSYQIIYEILKGDN